MAQVILSKRIKSISGKLGNLIFYTRNGKQFVRRASTAVGPLSDQYRSIIEPLSGLNIKILTTQHEKRKQSPS